LFITLKKLKIFSYKNWNHLIGKWKFYPLKCLQNHRLQETQRFFFIEKEKWILRCHSFQLSSSLTENSLTFWLTPFSPPSPSPSSSASLVVTKVHGGEEDAFGTFAEIKKIIFKKIRMDKICWKLRKPETFIAQGKKIYFNSEARKSDKIKWGKHLRSTGYIRKF